MLFYLRIFYPFVQHFAFTILDLHVVTMDGIRRSIIVRAPQSTSQQAIIGPTVEIPTQYRSSCRTAGAMLCPRTADPHFNPRLSHEVDNHHHLPNDSARLLDYIRHSNPLALKCPFLVLTRTHTNTHTHTHTHTHTPGVHAPIVTRSTATRGLLACTISRHPQRLSRVTVSLASTRT